MQYKELLYEVSDRILTITINRPERHNAFTIPMVDEFVDALKRADEDDNIRAVIITGNPDGRAFCAGADLGDAESTFDASAKPIMEHRDEGGVVVLAIHSMRKPVIAAINGSAVGVGFSITLACDIRIVSNKAKMGTVFARRGIPVDGCASYFLPRLVGLSNAMKMVVTGRTWSAEELDKMGLFYSVTEPENVMKEAMELAKDIAENCSAISEAVVKAQLWTSLEYDSPMQTHEIDSLLYWYVGSSKDAAEGVNSFLEKRNPDFKGKLSEDLPGCYPWWPKPTFRNKG